MLNLSLTFYVVSPMEMLKPVHLFKRDVYHKGIGGHSYFVVLEMVSSSTSFFFSEWLTDPIMYLNKQLFLMDSNTLFYGCFLGTMTFNVLFSNHVSFYTVNVTRSCFYSLLMASPIFRLCWPLFIYLFTLSFAF